MTEGEELLGSPNLEKIVNEHRNRLINEAAVLEVGAYQNREGKIDLYLGSKGKVHF